jgi:hypothetical protein
MDKRVSTTDLYESTFYLLGGCELLGIQAEKVNGSITCRLTFQGENLDELQRDYFAGRAQVLLFPFRRALGQVNALVYSARKKAKSRLRDQEQAVKGGES